MGQTASNISLKEIVSNWLLKREKHPNSKWKIYPIGKEAIQELALTSLPLIQHVILTRPKGQDWFDLPAGYTEYVSVGQPYGNSFRPLGVSNKLLPFADFTGISDLGDGFGEGYGNGDQQNWGNHPGNPGDFLAEDFSGGDFLDPQSASPTIPCGVNEADWWGGYNGLQRQDTVVIDSAQGQILTGSHFPCDKIYLVYVGIGGGIDSMTHIPIIAQAAIEAYIDWKYTQNKRGGIREGGAFRELFIKQHKILRARLNQITTTDIKQLRNQQWRARRYYGDYSGRITASTQTVFVAATAVYFGGKQTNEVPGGAQIILGRRQDYVPTANITLNYGSGFPEIAWAAWPAQEAGITAFYVDQFNFGPFGPNGLFATPVYSDGFWFTQTNYPTELQSVTLTHS